jgi:hypothetical protein
MSIDIKEVVIISFNKRLIILILFKIILTIYTYSSDRESMNKENGKIIK